MTTASPGHVTRPDFGASVRGYDRAQVDAYFARVVQWLADAENRAMVAERARESLASEVADLRATVAMLEQRAGVPAPRSMSAFGERMGQVMELALRAAQELRAEAEREAQERREAARREADGAVAVARAEAERIVETARRAQLSTEGSIDELRAARTEAVEVLLDVQRRIAEVVGAAEPSVVETGDEAVATAERVAAKCGPGAPLAFDTGHDDVDPLTATGVLVTASPTIVQPAVGPGALGIAPATRRRRSA